jgi:RNA polymerase sigma factor (sigma-70 family)
VQVSDSTPSTMADVLATEPVIRRIVASRIRNPADVDDLVHDCLERLLRARDRLARDTVLPFGIVTARNLVISQARTSARHTASAPFLLNLRQPLRPDDAVVADENREAMTAALDRLSPDERRDLIDYQTRRSPGADDERRGSPGAIRVRMARTRAKARLEYLLALRRVHPPTPVCKRVLLAVSGGDTRRQVAAGQHLLDCPTCAALSEPLEKRSLALTAVVFPVAVARWVAGNVQAHPASTALSTAAAVATAAVVAATTLHPSKPVARRNLHIVRGDHLRFVGTAEADGPSYPSAAQVTGTAGADLLRAEAAHVAVPTTSVIVEP